MKFAPKKFTLIVTFLVLFLFSSTINITNSQVCSLEPFSAPRYENFVQQVVDELPFLSSTFPTLQNLTSTFRQVLNSIEAAKQFAQNQLDDLDIQSSSQSIYGEKFDSQKMLTNFQTQQAIPAGTVRKFMGPEYVQIDSQSVCKNVIPHGADIFVVETLDPTLQMVTAASLYPMISLTNELTNCDLAVFTYFCRFVYPLAVPIPVSPEVTLHAPLLPCNSTYRQTYIADRCPEFAALGIIDAAPFAWGPDELCDSSTPAPRYIPDTTASSGVALAMQAYSCPEPFVTVDKNTYQYSTVMNGYCAMPCPSPIYSKFEHTQMSKWFLFWTIVSIPMGLWLVVSYWSFAALRKRVFVLIAVTSVQYQGMWIAIPFWVNIAVNGWSAGMGTSCSSAATPQTQGNFVCVMTGIAGVFGMYSSLLAVVSLGFTLVQKVVFNIHLSQSRAKLQERLLVAACILVPTIFCIVILAHHQFQGGDGNIYCGIAKPRDVTTGPNLADGLGLIPAAILVCIAYLELITVVVYLSYVKIQVRETAALTWAQLRILSLICVMSSLYLVIFIFRLLVEYRYKTPLGESITNWLICTLTSPGDLDAIQNLCGARPPYTISVDFQWYLLYIGASPGFTIFFAIGFSFDLLYCWAKFFLKLFPNARWLKPYAKRAPRASRGTSYKVETTQVASVNNDSIASTSTGDSQSQQPKKTLFKKAPSFVPGGGAAGSPQLGSRLSRGGSIQEELDLNSSMHSTSVLIIGSQPSSPRTISEVEMGTRNKDDSPTASHTARIDEDSHELEDWERGGVDDIDHENDDNDGNNHSSEKVE